MPNLGNILLNLVLILVAGALGALLAGMLAHYMIHWTTRRRAPHVVVQFFRMIGGLVAMVMAYLVLSTGGAGFGLGPGGIGFNGQGMGTGQGTGKGTGKGSAVATTEPPATTKGSTEKKTDKVEPGMMLKIEMLGGKRYQSESNRFYLVEGDKEPKTLAELTAIIQEKQKQPGFPGIEIIIYRTGSVAASHAAVKELKERATTLGVAVKTNPIDQDAPPLP